MKIPMQIITTLLLLSLATISLAKGQSGSGNLIYDPKKQIAEGFEIKVDYQWALSSLMDEPIKGMTLSWSYGEFNSLVPVTFKEMQNGEIVHTMAPRKVVEECYPITIELTAELKNRKGVTLSIDGGAISSSGDSYNVKGSPAWNKLFKRHNTFMPREKAKDVFYDKNLTLNFTENRSKVVFNLTPLKEWYAKSQLNKRVKTYCNELDNTYSNLKIISNKFPYAIKKAKLDTYCSLPANEVVDRLKQEINKLNDQDFIKSYFEGQEITKASIESSRAYKSAKNKTSNLHDMGGDFNKIIKKRSNEEKKIEKIVEAQLAFDEFESAAIEQLEAESGETFVIAATEEFGAILEVAEVLTDNYWGSVYWKELATVTPITACTAEFTYMKPFKKYDANITGVLDFRTLDYDHPYLAILVLKSRFTQSYTHQNKPFEIDKLQISVDKELEYQKISTLLSAIRKTMKECGQE